jgi:type I restriction enzyme S subunit
MVEWMKLGDIATIQKAKNKNHITEDAYSITQKGLVPTKSFFKARTNVTSNDTSGYYIVEKDWFVYSPSRIDVGSISFLKDDGPVIVSPIDVVFSINTKICLPSYLLSYFLSYDGMRNLLRHREGVEGTGRRNLPFRAIKNIDIPVPSLSEQERIVDTLDVFTNIISNLDEEIELRKQQYEFCHKSIFSGEDFDYVKIVEIAKDVFAGATPSTKVPEFWDDGDIPWMSSGEVHQGEINNVEKKITQLGYNGSSTKMVPLNSIVIALAGQGKTRGSVGITRTKLCTNQSLCAIVPNNDIIDSDYLYHYLRSQYYELRRISTGDGTRGGLNIQMINNFKVALPSLETQRMIIEKLEAFTSLISKLQEERDLRQKQYEYYREKLLTFE